ncbi:hypothetical protein Anas_09546, partial [Armadillidium nasatum]
VSFGFGIPNHNHNQNAHQAGQAIGQAIGGTINTLLGGFLGGGNQQPNRPGNNNFDPFGGGGGRGVNECLEKDFQIGENVVVYSVEKYKINPKTKE